MGRPHPLLVLVLMCVMADIPAIVCWAGNHTTLLLLGLHSAQLPHAALAHDPGWFASKSVLTIGVTLLTPWSAWPPAVPAAHT